MPAQQWFSEMFTANSMNFMFDGNVKRTLGTASQLFQKERRELVHQAAKTISENIKEYHLRDIVTKKL